MVFYYEIKRKIIQLFSFLIAISAGITSFLIFRYFELSIAKKIKELDRMMSLKENQIKSLLMHRTKSALESLKFTIIIFATSIAGGGIWAVFFVSSRITQPLNSLQRSTNEILLNKKSKDEFISMIRHP